MLGYSVYGDKRASGNIVSMNFNNTNFTSIEAKTASNVEIIQSPEYSITVYTDDNTTDNVRVEQIGERLILSFIAEETIRNCTYNFVISMPELRQFKVKEASSLLIKGFKSSLPLYGELAECSTANINFITGKDIDIKTSELCRITIIGRCNNLNLSAAEFTRNDFSELLCKDATIILDGFSRASVRLDGVLSYYIKEMSNLKTYGNISSITNQQIRGRSTYKHFN